MKLKTEENSDWTDPGYALNWKMRRLFISVSLILFLSFQACDVKPTPVNNPSETKEEIIVLPYYNDPTFTPNWFEDGPPKDFHQIPAFELINQHGNILSENELTGKVSVVNFFFTHCAGICPKMMQNMKLVHNEFEGDQRVLILSHSVTPSTDTVAKLANYANTMEIDGNWHLLTGERETIYDLGRNWYYAEEDLGVEKNPDDFLHTENFVLLDQNRHIRGIYNGLNKTSVQTLIEDIKLLKEEKP